ncbi:sprT domain-containing protein, partial [Citrobacter portucalensis]|nr:sprT domain-containing protein [Citrobacter portucalensis]
MCIAQYIYVRLACSFLPETYDELQRAYDFFNEKL